MRQMPFPIEPMKARLGDPAPDRSWEYEVKWDGYRALAFCGDRFMLQGRRLNEIGHDFPEIQSLGEDARARGSILDGELVVTDEAGRPDFQLMQSRRERGLRARFMVFDLLWTDGADLRDRPYLERRDRLEALGLGGEAWSVPERIEASLEEALAATRDLGLEGVIAKDPASPYVEGRRSNFWLKVKHVRRQEFVVGGWLPGKGSRESTIGAVLVGYHDPDTDRLRYAGRVGSGMDDAQLGEFSMALKAEEVEDSPFRSQDRDRIPARAHWTRPERVIEVKFTEWTRDGSLRNPVYLGPRPDKDPDKVVREER